MTIRRFSRLVIGIAALAFIAVLLFSGPTVSAGKGDRIAPTVPTNLVVTGKTSTTVSLSWGASTDNSGKLSYRVRISNLNNSAYNTLATVSQTQTTYTAKGLNTNTSYAFSVFAVDDNGNRSADSNLVNASTPGDTTPPATPVLEASVLTPSQVQLTWTEVRDDRPLNCCNYSFNVNGSLYTQHVNWVYSPLGKLAVTIRHLPPGSTNTFAVNVSDYNGNVATSNSVTVTTKPSNDFTPPSPPTNLRLVRDDSCGEVYIGWTQASDDTDPQTYIEYEIYVNGVLSPLPISAGIDVDFVYANFHGDNIFTVKAVDRSGNSSSASAPLKLFLWPC